MRIASWNVNSIKQRLPRFLPWLDERQPDVACLQETKLADDAFAEALGGWTSLGLHDVIRDRWPGKRVFTYWDYRAGMFHQDLGMRIDLILASDPVADRVKAAWIDRQARKGSGPSDHAPVIVDLDQAPDGDIGPVVPPPSRPAARRGTVKLPQSR